MKAPPLYGGAFLGYSKLAVGKFCTEPLRREPRLIFAMFAARLLGAVLAPLIYKGSCHAQRI